MQRTICRSYHPESCINRYNIVTLYSKAESDMAMTINSSPVLTGESAKAFYEEAERNGKLPTPRLSPEREAQLREYDRKCREFYHQLFGKRNG